MTSGHVAHSSSSRVIGTGEMADLVRAYDWSSTALGPIESWSKELLTIVNLTLCSPSPARAMWGEDFILIYNDAYRPIPGRRHPWALGKPAKEVYGEAWHVVGPLLDSAFTTGETCYYEKLAVPLETDHGVQDFYLNYSFNPIYEDGKITGLFGPVHDMTSEVLVTRERDAIAEQLKQVMTATTDGILGLDRNWQITYANRRAKEILEASGEPTGKNLWEAYPGTIYEGSPYVEHYHRAMEEQIGGHFEAFYGEPINVWLTILAQPSEDGIIIFFRDITHQRHEINELKRAQTALLQSEKLAAVGRLASSIAHEINNPLEAVMNLIYLARQHSEDSEAQAYLDTADQEIRRVSIIANQTLRFHKQASRPQAINSASLYSTVLGIYEGKLRNSDVIVEQKFRTEEPIVCFEGDIRQVLNNLVGNAIDAMPSGGSLLIRSRKGKHWATGRDGVVLTIADTGYGMSPETLRNIYEAFFTTKGLSGTGLGLWVSQEIVERHKGSLRVRSSEREGKSGTVFTLFLPFETERD